MSQEESSEPAAPEPSDTVALAQTCSDRERAFAHEYVADFCGAQAVLRSGCFNTSSRNSAKVIAWRLLAKPHVQALVEILREQRRVHIAVRQEEILNELSLLAHSDLTHYRMDENGDVQLKPGAPEGATRAISSAKYKKTVREDKEGNVTVTYFVEIKLWNKPESLKMRGRHVGMFTNKLEVTGKNGEPIEHRVTEVRRTVVPAPRRDDTRDGSNAQKPESIH